MISSCSCPIKGLVFHCYPAEKLITFTLFNSKRNFLNTICSQAGEPWPGQNRGGWGTEGTGDIGWEEGRWTTAGVVSWSPKGVHLVISLFQQGWGWHSLLFFCHARQSPAPGPLHRLSFYLDLFFYLILVFAPKRSCQWKPPLTVPLGTTILSPAVTIPHPARQFPVALNGIQLMIELGYSSCFV